MLSLEISLCSLILRDWLQRLTFTLDVLDCWFSAISLHCSCTKNIPVWRVTLHSVTHPRKQRPKTHIESAIQRIMWHTWPQQDRYLWQADVEMSCDEIEEDVSDNSHVLIKAPSHCCTWTGGFPHWVSRQNNTRSISPLLETVLSFICRKFKAFLPSSTFLSEQPLRVDFSFKAKGLGRSHMGISVDPPFFFVQIFFFPLNSLYFVSLSAAEIPHN